jgi:D-aminopeptidase
MLRGISVDALRNTESVRLKIQQDMSDIAAQLAPMVARVPSRTIRLRAED